MDIDGISTGSGIDATDNTLRSERGGVQDRPSGRPPAGIPGGPNGAMGGPPSNALGSAMRPGGGPGGKPVGAPPMVDEVSGVLSMPGFGASYAQMMLGQQLDNLALWYVDMRNFRSINPNFGYLAGNIVLRALAEGIQNFLSGDLPIARLGADRFIFLSKDMDYRACVEKFNEMIPWVSERIAEQGISYQLVLTAGIYHLRPADYGNPNFNRPLDYTSIAHRNARRSIGSDVVQFTDEDLERDNRRITIEQSIDEALKTGQIEVWYQPQVDYTYGEIIGAEALSRWNHPELGWISPSEFIPILEKCGKIHDLDLYVWEEACRSAGRWRNASDGNPVPISVNVSRAEMFESDIMEHFLELREKYKLPPGSLHLEVTESAFVEEAERLYAIIERMRENKLMVEMDDFGSGLSSLNMLKDVPVDVVKLDMGFMRTAVNEDRGGVVLASVIRMLQGLDTPIIAEGVETHEQAEMLKNMGCHLMQGFHFSHAMPLAEFEEFISSSSSVENAVRRKRSDSHIEDLMQFDVASSYLFNEAIGGMMIFMTEGKSAESLLVNDAFYHECGLTRDEFGNAKVNPIHEIDEDSRKTMWRAAAEAREHGSATCKAKIRISKRWIECVMRFVSSGPRGEVYLLNIIRSGYLDDIDIIPDQLSQDFQWNIGLLNKVVPNGFLKCMLDEELTIDYISSDLVKSVDMSEEEFRRRFHNSFLDVVAMSDRQKLVEAVQSSMQTYERFNLDICCHHGFDDLANVEIYGKVDFDNKGKRWLYALLLIKSPIKADGEAEGTAQSDRIISFDYYLADDRLVLHAPMPDGDMKDIVFERWLEKLDEKPEYIAPVSAAKISATVSDLKHHPVSGFTDLRCNLRGGESMRWYHVDFMCETDEEGNTTVVHGYGHDANDQMDSAKWWRRQAECDYLTGLLNRNAIEQQINVSIRTEGSGLMFMIDLDNFKRVNDELGHLTGDALLRDVSDVLDAHFRESDLLGRFGGDEFVAFMPVPLESAAEIAKKRAQDIIDEISKVTTSDGSHTACSVGVAICGNRNATFYDMLEIADQAMYESKEKGKGVYTIKTMAE